MVGFFSPQQAGKNHGLLRLATNSKHNHRHMVSDVTRIWRFFERRPGLQSRLAWRAKDSPALDGINLVTSDDGSQAKEEVQYEE